MSQVRVVSQVRVTSQVQVRFQFFFFSFFFSITLNDVRAVTRNINFPVGDIFHSRSKEPLPLRCYTKIHDNFLRILKPQVCTYLKNLSHLPDIPEKQTVKGVEARNI